jgi:uncharacterized membrane protein
MRAEVLAVILGMAAVTYATRGAGLWAGRGPLREQLTSERGARWLAPLPGAVLVSIIAPAIARGGAADALAAALAVAVAAITRNALATIAVGVLAAALLRRLIG